MDAQWYGGWRKSRRKEKKWFCDFLPWGKTMPLNNGTIVLFLRGKNGEGATVTCSSGLACLLTLSPVLRDGPGSIPVYF